MNTKHFIPLDQLCVRYEIEMSFFHGLMELDLLEITTIEQGRYLHQDKIEDLEKIIRLHQELYINFEGIDTVFNLLKKIESLQEELSLLKNRLGLYEN